MLHARLGEVTESIRNRSLEERYRYLDGIDTLIKHRPRRVGKGCANLAHGMAACTLGDKAKLSAEKTPNLAIVSAYNDMLSAHQPYERYPEIIRKAALAVGGTAQVAGGVPAMCDGVTQGEAGMELSLFSRDVIALSTAVALSHEMFDAAVFLGVCDKIVPGLMIGALSFGHLPAVFIPAGPMVSGVPNDQKAKIRQLYAEGKVSREALLDSESKSYHSPGTCTFYGTANTNQMLMEIMGLHMPGSSFVNPNTPLREAMTIEATQRALAMTALDGSFMPLGRMFDEKSLVNGVVGLLATGGSTNLTLHLIAIAKAAGLILTWEDFAALAEVVPLLARIYPNGLADVNHFHAAGGVGYLIGELLGAGLLHEDVNTVFGQGLSAYKVEAKLADDGGVKREAAPVKSHDDNILRPVTQPFQPDGGLKMLHGTLGRAVFKASAVDPKRHSIEAPVIVFHSQEEMLAAFKCGELERDFIAVVRFQGPKANGMPELHRLTPPLGVLQDRGFKVALITDGRMSGASGKVPAAIHVTPEAQDGGPIARLRTGDMVRLDGVNGHLDFIGDEAAFKARSVETADLSAYQTGIGRNLFSLFRQAVAGADEGASIF